MSMADLRHCVTFGTATLADHPGQEVIAGLHAETVSLVENEEDLEPA